MTTNNELDDLGDAASLVVERLVAPVEAMHGVISERTFRYVGPVGEPVRVVHDGLVGGVYRGIRWAAGVMGAGAGALLAARHRSPNPISDSRTGAGWQAAANAVWGDELDERRNSLAVALSIREAGRTVPVDGASLAATYPTAARHIVILLHGLGQTERCFQSGPEARRAGLHESLVDVAGLSPVLVRYNSGLPVARLGEELAGLLESLTPAWPESDARVSLLGYSMGGLVARSAYAAATAADQTWIARVDSLITVGTPHRGSAIERGVQLGSRALQVARTSRPLGDLLEARSAGIKDLGDGGGVAAAWEDAVPGSASGDGPAGPRQHFVAAAVTGNPEHPIGKFVGDMVVGVDSASGPSSVTAGNVHLLGGRNHIDLLSDREIIDQVIDWLRAPND